MRTDEEGRYEFETVVPANYPLGPDTPQLRARHIHFKVFAEGHTPLTTQLYFDDDPFLDLDLISDARLAVRLRKVTHLEKIRERGLMHPFFACTFDVLLPPLSRAGYAITPSKGKGKP
jgi:catechol 1,2-dioxygenase